MGKRTPAQKAARRRRDARKMLQKLDQPTIDGTLNLCYGDAYFAASIRDRFGSVERAREIAAGKDEHGSAEHDVSDPGRR